MQRSLGSARAQVSALLAHLERGAKTGVGPSSHSSTVFSYSQLQIFLLTRSAPAGDQLISNRNISRSGRHPLGQRLLPLASPRLSQRLRRGRPLRLLERWPVAISLLIEPAREEARRKVPGGGMRRAYVACSGPFRLEHRRHAPLADLLRLQPSAGAARSAQGSPACGPQPQRRPDKVSGAVC